MQGTPALTKYPICLHSESPTKNPANCTSTHARTQASLFSHTSATKSHFCHKVTSLLAVRAHRPHSQRLANLEKKDALPTSVPPPNCPIRHAFAQTEKHKASDSREHRRHAAPPDVPDLPACEKTPLGPHTGFFVSCVVSCEENFCSASGFIAHCCSLSLASVRASMALRCWSSSTCC